jgi:biotin carboxylase
VSEQGVLPAAYLRRHFSLPGQSVDSARDALIKSRMKQRFSQADLPCWPTYDLSSVEQAVNIAQPIGYPLIVKALASSGSRGVRKIRDRNQLRRVVKGMLLQSDYGGVGIEPFCDAKECSVELIVQAGNILFSNVTDYLHPGKTNLLPAKFKREFQDRLLRLAEAVMQAFEFTHGMLHIEFYYRGENIWLGEVNARPPGGGLMALIKEAYQFDPWQLVIKSQLSHPVTPGRYRRVNYLANWVIHPGKGVVEAIEGTDWINHHPMKHLFNLKVAIGQTVKYRHGTGSSVGELVLKAKNKMYLEKAMQECIQTLRIIVNSTK